MLPVDLHWLFWELDRESLDQRLHSRQIIARVLERGRMSDVRWLVQTYGLAEIRAFFHAGHPEISHRTQRLWALRHV